MTGAAVAEAGVVAVGAVADTVATTTNQVELNSLPFSKAGCPASFG